jgi:hypothetical protein
MSKPKMLRHLPLNLVVATRNTAKYFKGQVLEVVKKGKHYAYVVLRPMRWHWGEWKRIPNAEEVIVRLETFEKDFIRYVDAKTRDIKL